MKRIGLLALVALALPTAGFAGIIPYVNGPCQLNKTTCVVVGSPTAGSSYSISTPLMSANGFAATGQFSFSIGNLVTAPSSNCLTGSTSCFSFTSASLTITDTTNSAMSFSMHNAFSGTMSVLKATSKHPQEITINAIDMSGDITEQLKVDGTVSGLTDVLTTPELGTLGLLGTGLIGLAALARRGDQARRTRRRAQDQAALRGAWKPRLGIPR